jgi:archaemetzincin
MPRTLLAVLSLLAAACSPKRPHVGPADAGADPFAKLARLHPALGKPREGEWRDRFREAPQSFGQYRDTGTRPTAGHDVIYVVVLGELDPGHARVVEETERLLSLYFGAKVKRLAPVPKERIPGTARRRHPSTGERQLYTVWVLEELLPPLMPADALSLLAFTSEDLYPDPDWNFVFGEASPAAHAGVWSLHRLGDPATEPELVLRRTIKTAAHEGAHSFGLHHCTESRCVMNGANTLEEADRWPLEPCPVCLRKLQWAFGFDVRKRFEQLCAFHADAGLTEESAECAASLSALGGER